MILQKPHLTFDTNCLIDLETQRLGFEATREIVNLWLLGKVNLSVVAISASEKKIDGNKIDNYKQFQLFLKSIGLEGVDALKPIGYWDITFLDWMLYSGEEMKDLEIKIHNILFPNIQYECDYLIYKKWLNAKIDVLVAWSHIWNRRNILITRDDNFRRKENELQKLGIGKVYTPEQFLCDFHLMNNGVV